MRRCGNRLRRLSAWEGEVVTGEATHTSGGPLAEGDLELEVEYRHLDTGHVPGGRFDYLEDDFGGLPRIAMATRFGRKRSRCAASRTRALLSALTGWSDPDTTRDAVEGETPARRATSRSDTSDRGAGPGRDGRGDGLSTGSVTS
jgi:hypothetical protein